MAVKQYTIKQGQSIFDVAVDIYGDISYAIPLIVSNPELEDVSNTDMAGMVIEYDEPTPSPFKPVKIVETTVFKSVTIGKDKTPFDVALQYYGGAEFVFDFIRENGLESIESDLAGRTLQYTELNTFVPLYFRKTGKQVATKYPIVESTSEVPFSYLLDSYSGASVAYSINRKLRSSYSGSCIRVRRDSDNSELDIGFVDNLLNESSLLAFVGAGNGYIVTVYDQSGNGNDLTQATALDQPQIVSSGVIQTAGGKAAISFASGDGLGLTTALLTPAPYSAFNLVKRNASSQTAVTLLRPSPGTDYFGLLFSDNIYYSSGDNNYIYSTSTDAVSTQVLITSLSVSGPILSMYKNGALITTAVGAVVTTGTLTELSGTGLFQELVYYNADQATNRVGIESNIIIFYGL